MSQPVPSLPDFWDLRYSAGGGPLTRTLSQRIGALAAWTAGRAGLAPAAVTLTGASVFIAGAAAFAWLPAGWTWTVACAAAFQLAYGLDCADGQLARATGRVSAFGAWLDLACDHVRNAVLAGALAYWLAATRALPLAGAMFIGVALMAGMSLKLHALAALRAGGAGAVPQPQDATRRIASGVLDTPFFLLGFALLREAPPWLALYAGAMGLAYGAVGAAQALRHLSRGKGAGSA